MTDIDFDPRPENHVGELRLRRYLAGELDAAHAAALEQRIAEDHELRARLRSLREEQAAFADEIPFERFADGVSRARRSPAPSSRPARRLALAGTVLAAAASVALFALSPQTPPSRGNRIKGQSERITVRIAPGHGGAQRDAGAQERLGAGDRVRIGYACQATAESSCQRLRHLAVLSIDEQGEATALYPEAGNALAVEPGAEPVFLPDSVEFIGQGLERLFVLLSDEPFTVDAARRALLARFAANRGKLDDNHGWRGLELSPSAAPLALHSFLFFKP